PSPDRRGWAPCFTASPAPDEGVILIYPFRPPGVTRLTPPQPTSLPGSERRARRVGPSLCRLVLGRGRFGLLGRRPAVRQKIGQFLLRMVRQARQHVAQVHERVVPVTLATRHDAEQNRHRFATVLTPGEQPVFSSNRNCL